MQSFKFDYFYFLLSLVLLASYLRNHWLMQDDDNLLLMFSFKGFIVLALLFRPAVHFELHVHMVWVSNQFHSLHVDIMGFPGNSAGKENSNSGDPGSIPGLGRSPEEGTGYPLQHSWASLVTQMVKNPPVVPETWVWSLDWEDPLEEGMATHSSILAWRIPTHRGAWSQVGYSPWGEKESRHDWATKHIIILVSFIDDPLFSCCKSTDHKCKGLFLNFPIPLGPLHF